MLFPKIIIFSIFLISIVDQLPTTKLSGSEFTMKPEKASLDFSITYYLALVLTVILIVFFYYWGIAVAKERNAPKIK
ncbi:unnamed protein product [Caenorhabditis angaria]|uniref:CcmD family protein n=1 Tax=Caenorhabditis angaria TaxID=860376 RepID=A0A9P1NAB8_9PELO|nr:unnamed protein product [Caenorhabditis angaria]